MNTAELAQAQEAPEVAPEAPPTAGQALAAARQSQNFSIADISSRLKLSVHQIEALEQGAYDRLPGPVFVRGFARNYARLLKLDADAIVQAIDAQLPKAVVPEATPQNEAHIPMPARNGGRWPVFAVIAAAIFLGAALIDVLWPESTPNVVTVSPTPLEAPAAIAPSAENAPAAVALIAAPADATPAPITSRDAPATAVVPAITMVAPAAPVPPVAPVIPAAPVASPAPAGATVSPAPVIPPGSKGRVLQLVFNQACWAQVRDATGTVLLEGLFPAGTARQVVAVPPARVILGNAPGVRVTYGDRVIDLAPQTQDAVARVTLE